MIVDQNVTIGQLEQLWYTWSELGIDTIEVGFRIRAASPGLHDFRSERVQTLDQYQRYTLPRGTESMVVPPEQAPVCISLIRPEGLQECILVHKAYTGKDGFGRNGAFFVHLLFGLPLSFSARKAITLWDSPFWQTSDKLLKENPYNTFLPLVSPDQLWEGHQGFNFQDQHAIKSAVTLAKVYLPFLIQAYLEKHPRKDHKGEHRSNLFQSMIGALTLRKPLHDESLNSEAPIEKIYIAAADRDVALLIYALTCCLPSSFVHNLTFSTYERDASAAQTEIVGTCWLGHTSIEAEHDPRARELFPNEYYREKLALNCYSKKISTLDEHPLISHRRLAKKYAQDATQYFLLRLTKEYQYFARLSADEQLNFVQDRPEFKVLLAFAELFETADLEPQLDIDAFLNLYDSTVLNPEQVSGQMLDVLIMTLSMAYVANRLSRPAYQRALVRRAINDHTWWQFAKQAVLRWQQQSAQLPALQQVLLQTTHQCIRSLVALINKGLSDNGSVAMATHSNEHLQFDDGLDLLFCLSNTQSIWLELLDALAVIKGVYAYFKRNPQPYSHLVERWANILHPDEKNVKKLKPLLPPLFAEFDKLQALHLPAPWEGMIIKDFLESTYPRKPFIDMLEQYYHEHIRALFIQLTQGAQWWSVAEAIFNRLVTDSYKRKLSLLFVLLDAVPTQNIQTVRKLVQTAKLTIGERAPFLIHYGPRYLKVKDTINMMISILSDLVRDDSQQVVEHREKMDVLVSWLNDHELASWFDEPTQSGADRLAMLLGTAKLTLGESGIFLRRYGSRYCINYPTPGILMRLLHNYAQSYMKQLWTINVNRWQQDDASTTMAEIEGFLWFLSNASLPPDYQQLFYDWYTLAVLIREPQLSLQQYSSQVASCIGHLLVNPNLSSSTHDQIIEKLVIACLVNENSLPNLVELLTHNLAPRDILQLLYAIADYAGIGIHERRYNKTLFEACIHYASVFKTMFSGDRAQRSFVRIFLNTLLQYADKQEYRWLQQRTQKWPETILADWRIYKPALQSPAINKKQSFRTRLQLWWEHRTATFAMRRALKSRKEERILEVYMKHLVTLQMHRRKLTDAWRKEVERALLNLDMYSKAERQRNEEQLTVLISSNKPSLLTYTHFWWKRFFVLLPLQRALRSRRIGSIVYIVRVQSTILEKYGPTLPREWQLQIEVATGFFHACDSESANGTQMDREQEIVEASEEIVARRKAGLPAPRLTMHEELRVEEARQYLTFKQKQQRKQDQLNELFTLLPFMMLRAPA